MDRQQIAGLERAIDERRSLVESSRALLFEIEQFLAEARTGAHSSWVESLIERRSRIQGDLEQARLTLSQDEDTYRRAVAN